MFINGSNTQVSTHNDLGFNSFKLFGLLHFHGFLLVAHLTHLRFYNFPGSIVYPNGHALQ